MTSSFDSIRSQRQSFERAAPPRVSAGLAASQVCALVAANTIEFFDFFMYTTLAAYICRAFFPADAAGSGTLLSLFVFAVGYLSRPIGGAIIGRYADVRGRKRAVLLTGPLITLGTVGIAITPSYQTIGGLASVAILAFRALQGFAIGGEMGSSSALLIESGPAHRAGRYGGYQMAGQGFALLAAGACGLSLSAAFSPSFLSDWGWRVPFALGAMLVPVQLFLRRSALDPAANLRRTASSGKRLPDYGAPLILSVLLILGGTVPTYVVIYVTSSGIAGPAPSLVQSFATTCVTGLVTLAASIAGGALADRLGLNAVVLASRLATALLVYPAFSVAIAYRSAAISMLMIALIAGVSAVGAGPTIALILQKFRLEHRARGLSLSYAIGVALFGGTAPLVAAGLVRWSGSQLATAWYVIIAATCASLAQLVLMKYRSYPLSS
ncbi:MFS transporter [Paraburkholderia fungorum]|uniref:MFS family permease n=1 Tax=Paraburkholderia fungorum TaxID=134537 RepID=A0AAW3UQF1_9BURK|nr:MFS transporter [Paraburkholderia fungorum]MBB4513628.1 MFS family permease [Paraburkholderia fungorum]MBB6200869.1 MFS family permease [Paraburkholderia fungorum]MBU7439727.1 MFS transporter [Paraburkholderia fungorum]